MYTWCEVEIVNLKDDKQFSEVQDFLARFNLTYDHEVEYTVALRCDGRIVGTGSFVGEVLRNIAVDDVVQGSGLTSMIVSALVQEQARRGKLHYFIFTTPNKAHLFGNLGFVEIARAEPYVALLETGIGSVEAYCENIQKQTAHLTGERAAVVVNCNPFTKGHRALIQKAASENSAVIVFVVSEDRSLFPFMDRMKLVKDGVSDLDNVVVVPADRYIISAATFPTYFTRDEDKVVAQTRLDISLFATQIAPRLGIKRRYVGEEPYCSVTNAYNQAMADILPKHGVEVQIMKRIEVNGEIVSASKVRKMIKLGVWTDIRKIVPENTYHYLISAAARDVVDRVLVSTSRH